MRARFNGKLSPDEAMEVLRAASQDKAIPPIVRMHIAAAMLEIQTGRTVQSAMARMRRATGLDPGRLKKQQGW